MLLVQIEQKQRPPANIEIRHRCGGRSSPRGSRWAGRCSRRRRHRGGRWEKGRERTVDADGQAGRTTNSTWSESRRESRARGAAAAKRVVKSIRRGKGKTTKSGARKSRTAKTGSRSEKSKPTVTKARRHSSGRKNRIKGNRARAKKPRR